MSSYVWVLTITIIGANPEYKELPKFANKNECQAALDSLRQEYIKEKKRIAGACKLLLRNSGKQ